MQDSRDHHIDDFVRKVASQPDIQMEPGDWQAMEAMLDQEMPVTPVGGFWLYHSANVITLLALLGALYIGLFGASELAMMDQHTAVVADCEWIEEVEPALANETCTDAANVADGREDQSTLQPPTARSSQPFREKITPSGRSVAVVNEQREEPPLETVLTKQDYPSDELLLDSAKEISKEIEREIVEIDAVEDAGGGAMKEIASPTAADTAATDSVLVTTETVQPAPPVHDRRLAMGVLMAPDFNSVGFGGETRASGMVGVVVTYRMAPRWVLSTGIQYNRKKYVTTGAEYAPPYGYWQTGTNGRVPDVVNGQCAVVDVPITVGYEWPLGQRLRLLTSAGLSSYLLQNEDYFFEFEQPNPGAAPGWSSDAKSSALLGIANASVLVRWPVTRRLNVSAGPYLKVPLRDIGWGSVRMYGSGAVVMILYDLF